MAILLTVSAVGTATPASWNLNDDKLNVNNSIFRSEPQQAKQPQFGGAPRSIHTGSRMRIELSGTYEWRRVASDAAPPLATPFQYERDGTEVRLSGAIMRYVHPTTRWVIAHVLDEGALMVDGLPRMVNWRIIFDEQGG